MPDSAADTPEEAPAQLDPAHMAAECETAQPWAHAGSTFGPIGSMGLGAGMVIADVLQPRYLPEQEAYGTARGPALILSHECDIDPENVRPFNDNVLIAPIIRIDRYIEAAASVYEPNETRSFLLHVASGHVSRMVFLPRFGDENSPLYFGGLIDLNSLTSAAASAVAKAKQLCAMSGYGLRLVDFALQEHLMRPKVEATPLPA